MDDRVLNWVQILLLGACLACWIWSIKSRQVITEIKEIPTRLNNGMKPFAKTDGKKLKPKINDDRRAVEIEQDGEQ